MTAYCRRRKRRVTIIHLGESSCTHTCLQIFCLGTGGIGRMCCSAFDRKTILMPLPHIYMTAYVMEIKWPKLYWSTGNILFRKERILYIYIYTHTPFRRGGGINRYSKERRVYVRIVYQRKNILSNNFTLVHKFAKFQIRLIIQWFRSYSLVISILITLKQN